MRPITLKMTGFGPYAGETIIDFGKLGEKGLYLITGATGAGKTIIFDAISYALYGEASGGSRKGDDLRSKYAAPETPTEVELTFECGGATYCVKRNPEYLRPKDRGTGFTKKNADAELKLPGGAVVTKIKEVTNRVTEIIGIDKDQFSQIVMIAQGDFLKVLHASTEDRKKIFRKIFHTEKYNALQDSLKAACKELEDRNKLAKAGIEQYIDGIVCPEDSPCFPETEKAKAGELPVADTVDLLDRLIGLDESEETALTGEIRKADGEKTALAARISKADKQEETKKLLAQNRDKLTAALAEGKELQIKKEEADGRKPEAEVCTDEIAALNAKLPLYNELEEAGNRLNVLRSSRTAAAIKEKESELQELAGEAVNLKREFDSLQNTGEEILRLETRQKEIDQKNRELDSLAKDVRELQKLREMLEKQQKLYRNASSEAKEKKDAYDRGHRLYLDEQAGILAETLEEGQPCPVCGSCTHPLPAEMSGYAPDKDELERLKKAAEDAARKAETASTAAGTLKGTAEEKERAVLEKAKSLLPVESEKEVIPAAAAERAALLKEAGGLADKLQNERLRSARKENLESRLIPENERKRTELSGKITELKQRLSSEETETKTLNKRVGELSGSLKFPTKTAAETEIRSLTARRSSIEDMIRRATDRLTENGNRISALNKAIEDESTLLQDAVEYDLAGDKARSAELDTVLTGLRTKEKVLHARLSGNRNIRGGIAGKKNEAEEIEKRLIMVKALSDTANGYLRDRPRIGLETYVQTAYFDRIIAKANLRLLTMTDNQYEMKRRTEKDGNVQIGLDLDIIDHYNGSKRDIKSLSGGESFQASLSLALGLSDVIQSDAGGIRLDTMFVDEGFGTLDTDTLEKAMSALLGLAESNKLIGIISHVEGLMERIDKQIVVKKERSGGSTATVVLP